MQKSSGHAFIKRCGLYPWRIKITESTFQVPFPSISTIHHEGMFQERKCIEHTEQLVAIMTTQLLELTIRNISQDGEVLVFYLHCLQSLVHNLQSRLMILQKVQQRECWREERQEGIGLVDHP